MALWSVLLISLLAVLTVEAYHSSVWCWTGSTNYKLCNVYSHDVGMDSKIVPGFREEPLGNCEEGKDYRLVASDYYPYLGLYVSPGCGGTFYLMPSTQGSWKSWGDWGPCSVSCGANGTQTRSRLCDTGTPTDCKGQATDTRTCHGGQCPRVTKKSFMCCWTRNVGSNKCDVKREDVEGHTRIVKVFSENNTRVCEEGKDYGLISAFVPYLWVSSGCGGTFSITSSRVPSWESWGDWGTCSVSCGANGIQTRSRLCDTGTPTDCKGQATDTRTCHGGQCPQVPTTAEALPFCGKSASSLGYRIIGGTEADKCKYPWMVVTYNRARKEMCGGSIIDKTHILTAAHCVVTKSGEVDSIKNFKIYSGATEIPLKRKAAQIDGLKIRDVSNIKIHDKYDAPLLDNDIAIITLSEPIAFDTCHIPICLPDSQDKVLDASGCKVMGWGLTKNMDSSSQSPKLLEVDIKVHKPEICETGKFGYGKAFTRSIKICAGDQGSGTCRGDSGGPLTCKDKEGRHVQYGIVSGGETNKCGQVPNFYTRVTHFKDWIAENTK